MSRDELITNIGTIAKSGTRQLLEQIRQEGKSAEVVNALIGRFGVGFYSAFMVADKVSLVTRRAGEDTATHWESTGDGHYTLAPATRSRRGTSITLHLKPVDADSGIEDYTQSWVLSRIVKRYSDFVAYPIQLKEERDEVERDEQGLPKQDGKTTHVVEDKTLNSMKPIWTRPLSDVTTEEYAEFYKHISHDWEAPLKTMTFKAEGRFEFQCLVFIPARAPFDLHYHTAEYGLQLYAQRIMIMEHCADLIPRYLRFLKGVVDSADLPLNISRQRLQQDRHITQIRSWLVRRVLDDLATMHRDDNATYLNSGKRLAASSKRASAAITTTKTLSSRCCCCPRRSMPNSSPHCKPTSSACRQSRRRSSISLASPVGWWNIRRILRRFRPRATKSCTWSSPSMSWWSSPSPSSRGKNCSRWARERCS